MSEQLSKSELSQLAKFKLLMRKVHQLPVDLSIFVSDVSYAKDILDLAEDTDHEDLMMLAIEIRSQFGLLQAQSVTITEQTSIKQIVSEPKAPTPVIPKPEAPPIEAAKDRYKFSLR